MKIVLHPGLHKTGTTSIQMFLRSAFGSDAPRRIWYPMTPILNPGHAAVPFNLRTEHLQEQGLRMIRDYVNRAAANGTETLLISAEGISRLKSETLMKMRECIAGHCLQVIVTLTSYKARAVSQWQEGIKHKQTKPIDDQWNILNPKFEPGVVSRVTEALKPDDCIVIIGNRANSPDWLINRFLEAAGLRDSIEDPEGKLNYSMRANRSFGRIEIEIIRHLNICIQSLRAEGIDFDESFVKKRIIACLTSKQWKEQVPKVALECPESWAEHLRKQAFEAKGDIEKLQESGRIRVIRNIESLIEGI